MQQRLLVAVQQTAARMASEAAPLRVNFRDVSENIKGIRPGKLYRSSCCFAPPNNVLAIVDLRRNGATKEKWHRREDGSDVTHYLIPMVGARGGISLLFNLPLKTFAQFLCSGGRGGSEVVVGRHYFSTPDNIVDMYMRIAENASPQLEKIARIIVETTDADPNAGVTVFCVAGKDRTGIVVSLFARLAGASIEDIAKDYSESQENLRKAAEEGQLELVDPLLLDGVLTRSPWESMLAFLRSIETKHGSVRNFLEKHHQIDTDLLDRLERILRSDSIAST